MVEVKAFDFFTEAFEIDSVTYHPALRHQEITLFVPGLNVEETLTLGAAMRKASKLLQPRFEGMGI